MDKFATLEPTKLYSSPTQHQRPPPFSTVTSHVKSTARVSTQVLTPAKPPPPPIGRLPVDLHVLALMHVPIPDIARYARASKATSRVARDERVWERRWLDLAAQRLGLGTILDELEARAKAEKDKQNGGSCGPATLAVSSLDDDFGDFASAPPPALFDLSSSARLSIVDTYEPGKPTPTFRAKYIRAHTLLYPLLPTPNAPLHAILASLTSHLSSRSDSPAANLLTQARVLHLLARFLSPVIKPVSTWDLRLASLKAALDRFDATLLTAFDAADTSGDEAQMKGVASASWEISICTNSMGRRNKRGGAGDWEMGRLWAEKREVFYEQGKWDPAANFTKDTRLDFTAMDGFMSHLLAAIEEDGARAFRVFPRESGVLLAFAERIADDVISEYISSLLARARTITIPLFLSATAACFREAFRVVDSILTVSGGSKNRGRDGESGAVKVELAEDVIYKMFEPNMDDYLDDEMDELKRALEMICKDWERSVTLDRSQSQTQAVQTQTRFLDSQNPALMKRNVLASFTDVLLLPVTIVPRAVGAGVGAVGAIGTGVGAAIGTGVGAVGTGVVQGIAMLNPQRWVGNGGAVEAAGVGEMPGNGYQSFGKDGALFEVGEDDDEPEDADAEEATVRGSEEGGVSVGVSIEDEAGWGEIAECQTRGNAGVGPDTGAFDASGVSKRTSSTSDVASTKAATTLISTKDASRSAAPSVRSQASARASVEALDLLLSLDVSLQLIHATRDAMKRLETFAAYPGATGTRVRETLDETFCQMLNALSTRHVAWGFGIANERMTTYKPAEHEGTTSVAPLLQFFELVHIGDTIQSMVQVFFDKEIAPHIDKTDFLNVVVRERKRFEDMLDECVASGLNAGTQVLMNQVDHIIQTLTKPREYYPPEDAPLDLRPTEGCREAIQCLETHCKLLKGNTSRELLEVFYQEVGIRLLAILQKHIKRQIISLNGGFQVIADLNAYHAFIASLKVPNVTTDFDHLKMLGHVFVVEDAKDLAQIVRDVTRYGGSYRPEDVYEFIQRRSDWKKIEKTVDKAMYNLSFKEDCVVC
ncbi:exocyst complex component Sec10-domain-containing protein [Boletus edulis BED1]|uniref:Exocyst complex component Sec10-domain-containing protein n=1 Tax=Boletus edulis BED1 TaxID=1328754 RepID=A0AAD4GM53_BOLED|nr:exocyst complex component Sec10-domain-containing protein [Boletus edulis BED1]